MLQKRLAAGLHQGPLDLRGRDRHKGKEEGTRREENGGKEEG